MPDPKSLVDLILQMRADGRSESEMVHAVALHLSPAPVACGLALRLLAPSEPCGRCGQPAREHPYYKGVQ